MHTAYLVRRLNTMRASGIVSARLRLLDVPSRPAPRRKFLIAIERTTFPGARKFPGRETREHLICGSHRRYIQRPLARHRRYDALLLGLDCVGGGTKNGSRADLGKNICAAARRSSCTQKTIA